MLYVKRLVRVYIVFFILDIVSLVLTIKNHSTNSNGVLAVLGFLNLAFYLMNIGTISYAAYGSNTINQPAVLAAQMTTATLLILNIITMLYSIIVLESLYAIFTVISIVLQLSTNYLFHRLRLKVKDIHNQRLLESGNNTSSATAARRFHETPSAPKLNSSDNYVPPATGKSGQFDV